MHSPVNHGELGEFDDSDGVLCAGEDRLLNPFPRLLKDLSQLASHTALSL